MAPKRMTAVRIDSRLADRIDRLAEAEGVSRTAWHERALAREALRASGGDPQAVDAPGDDRAPAPAASG